jgi:predicted Zn-dependent protease
MKIRTITLLACFLAGNFAASAQDSVFNTLKSELNRNFSILKEQTVPAYYIYLRLDEIQSVNCVGRLGRLQSAQHVGVPTHYLSACLRVGDRNLDNSHELRESGYGNQGLSVSGDQIPCDNNPRVLRNSIWLQLDELYKHNVQVYDQIRANIAVKVEQEDKSPDFSIEKVEKYYESPIAWDDLKINPKIWEDKVRAYSKVFNENEDILEGTAIFTAHLNRKLFVDTEGRELAQNEISFQLALTAGALADDGMDLPLFKTWMAYSLDELPSDETVLQAAREMSRLISALKKAPVVESFTGPAILSPEAAGVFFHEIFGHRVEGSRLKEETDAQTFKKKIGERVLLKNLSVTFDPTAKYYGQTPLVGNYVFDDEGIRAEKVEIVKNGVLKGFLMSRKPIEGFAHSNGHGRAQPGAAPVSRQSNLIVESSQKIDRNELIKKLRKEAKSQGKEYAYYFKEVSGGFTNTNRYSPNAFNVNPLVVYRIYTDGRPDELVRGVDLVGTPLAMFAQIEACGSEYAVFNGVCGAESGSLPVSCVSPSLLVKQVETQKRAKGQSQPPILSKPKVSESDQTSEENLIAESIREETDRALQGLKMQGLHSPFFISYTLSDVFQLFVSASSGSIVTSDVYPYRTGSARLLMGDYGCTDENFTGTAGASTSYDGTPTLDNDKEGIRYTVWRDMDAIYKSAAETYEQKLSAIKQLNIPAKDLELPDWDKTPPVVVMNDLPIPEINFEKARYEEYVKAASSVFNDYPEIFDSNVSLRIYKSVNYFYNTEKSEFRLPVIFATLVAEAQAKTEEGEDVRAGFDLTVALPDDFPVIDDFKKKCRDLAEKLLEETKAPKLTDAYAGPVLYEGLSVGRTFYFHFFHGENSLIALRKPLTPHGISYGGNGLEEMIDKRITSKDITIEDLSGTSEYKGVKLLGYMPIDAQAVVPPKQLTLVENGILKTLLNDRVPTPKVPYSNGHASFDSSTKPGVVRMINRSALSKEELRRKLFHLAEAEGYDYAYIVRDVAGGGAVPLELYRVNIADGTETRIRSAVVKNIDAHAFNRIAAVSDEELIYNGSIAGSPISVIVPDAILFEELRIQSNQVDNFRKPPLTPQR